MESIKEIYKIGHGPSSSHTMGPRRAAKQFLEKVPDAAGYKVTLYGSLAATGLGHLTYKTIEEAFTGKQLELIGKSDEFLSRHSNAMKFEAVSIDNKMVDEWVAYSVGGGTIIDDHTLLEDTQIYPLSSMEKILDWCYNNGKHIWEYVDKYEGPEIWDYLVAVWSTMKASVLRGLDTEGTLPGKLKLPRKAAGLFLKAKNFKDSIRKRSMLYTYALAASEENAGGGKIVTAPTCGACGVMPSVLYYHHKNHKTSENKILRALATAGIVGNLVKKNASISGAEVGCQGEIGTACAMASAVLTQLSGGSIFQIEYAAEMGLEHHLGLTCDPVYGLVQKTIYTYSAISFPVSFKS
ncbi:MAG: L-serine ammonia-lyase, iron-sulfur-dependent, subunit alpha [Deltaproteobacteria bacterium]|nr:L-serine ammonia-lyase, iron-sulfur-dependent, subunit alpha [Deltaproteobacteria bacterium]